MATRGDYFPVDPEDRSSSRLLENNPLASTEDSPRSENNDAKGHTCISMWSFSLIIIGLAVMFLVGICAGFYVRELQKGDPRAEGICGATKKMQEIDFNKLGGLHETLVYYIRGEEIREFVSEFGQDDPVTGSVAEKRLANVVLEKFNDYRIDTMDVENHELMVTHADPDHPNQLEILDHKGATLQHMMLVNNLAGNSTLLRNTTTQKWKHPCVVSSPAGNVQGKLVYGHYGRYTDFLMLQAMGLDVKSAVILLRLGKLSVAEKVKNCESHGAQAVLLYWEPHDVKDDVDAPVDASYIPFASASTYSTESTVWRPSIPCQTISTNQAKIVLSLLYQANNSRPAPVSWQGSLVASYFLGGQQSDSIMVHLSVFNIPEKQRIQNFISTIQGTDEPDRYVIVGVPRSSLPGQSHDVVASTSVLIQLAHSFNYMYKQHQWKPRRGVKLISWGGAEFSNSGMLHYISNHHQLLNRRAVAYFDLSQLAMGNGSIIANIPVGLHQLIKETTFDVPDPRNAEQTLQMSWNLLMESNNNLSQQDIIPLESYHSDSTHNPFLHILGVPEVKLQYRAPLGSLNSVQAMTAEDLGHHYKFHITVTHIIIKSLLIILDNELLPMNLLHEASALQAMMWQTSDVLELCYPDMNDFNPVNTLYEEDLLKTAEDFHEVSNIFVKKYDKQGVRMVNDISMSFHQFFVKNKNGLSQHILYPVLADGSLMKATDLCEVLEVTRQWNITTDLTESLTSALKNVLTLLHFSA